MIGACSTGSRAPVDIPGSVAGSLKENETVYYHPPPEPLDEGQAKKKFLRSYQPALPPTKIALLVPLTGKYEKLGQNLLDAAQLALFSLNEPNLALIPIDTKGTTFGAVEAAKQAGEQGAALILGPVFSKSTKAMLPTANQYGLNVVSFSNDKSLANSGAFAIGFIPEQQIQRIVQFALDQGINEFATVAPNNNFGAISAKVLRETIASDDQRAVLKTEIYQRSKSGKPLKLKRHVSSAYNALLNNKPPKDYDEKLKQYNDEPIQFPRALLLPDSDSALQDITAHLEQLEFDSSKVQLLGSGQWYEPSLLRNPIVQGAWFASPPRQRRARFEKDFVDSYDYQPIRLSGLAYDGIALAATLIRFSKNQGFHRSALTNPRGFMGIDGIFRLKENGLTERGLAVMRINNNAFEVIQPAPSSFFDIMRPNTPPVYSPTPDVNPQLDALDDGWEMPEKTPEQPQAAEPATNPSTWQTEEELFNEIENW